MIEQLQMPHTTVCQAVKVSLQFQLAGSSGFVNFVYVVSETESHIFVFFRGEGTFEPTTEMLIRESKTNPLTWEIM